MAVRLGFIDPTRPTPTTPIPTNAHITHTNLVGTLPPALPRERRRLHEGRRERRPTPQTRARLQLVVPWAPPLLPQRAEGQEDEQGPTQQAAEGEGRVVEGARGVRPEAQAALGQHEQADHQGHAPLLPSRLLLGVGVGVGGAGSSRRRRHGEMLLAACCSLADSFVDVLVGWRWRPFGFDWLLIKLMPAGAPLLRPNPAGRSSGSGRWVMDVSRSG